MKQIKEVRVSQIGHLGAVASPTSTLRAEGRWGMSVVGIYARVPFVLEFLAPIGHTCLEQIEMD